MTNETNTIKESKQEKRKYKVYEILINKVKTNLDVLFDFSLSESEFKKTYRATKQELKEVI